MLFKRTVFVFSALALLAVFAVAQQDTPAVPAEPAPPASEAKQPEVAPGAVVLSVGDQSLTREQFENLILALPAQLQAAARGPQKKEFARQIAELLAVAAEAEKENVHQRPEVAMRLKYQRDNILASVYYQQMVERAEVGDAQAMEFYEKNKESYEEARAKHILVRFKGSRVPQKEGQAELSPEEALTKAAALKKRLEAGESFDEVAKAESDDTGSAQTGGSLGSFGRGQMIPEFEQAAFEQPLGVVSEPVKTAFGYHLILVEERTTKPFEQVKAEIVQQLKPQVAREGLKAMAEAKGVNLNEQYFAEAPAPEPTTGGN